MKLLLRSSSVAATAKLGVEGFTVFSQGGSLGMSGGSDMAEVEEAGLHH